MPGLSFDFIVSIGKVLEISGSVCFDGIVGMAKELDDLWQVWRSPMLVKVSIGSTSHRVSATVQSIQVRQHGVTA